MSELYRQGDVLVQRVGEIPADVTPVKRESGRIILAHGEVTGHAHAIKNRLAKFLETTQGERYLSLPKQVTLDHEEHSTITLPAGNYKVIRQREYHPEEIRNVAD